MVEEQKIRENYASKKQELGIANTDTVNRLKADFESGQSRYISIITICIWVALAFCLSCLLELDLWDELLTGNSLGSIVGFIFCLAIGFIPAVIIRIYIVAPIYLAINACINAQAIKEAKNVLDTAIQENREKYADEIHKLEQEEDSEIHQLEQEKDLEIRRLKLDVNNKVNEHEQRYLTAGFTPYLTKWLMSEFADVIEKADRSPYYPQIKAKMSFQVYPNRIEVYRSERNHPDAMYDLAEQGLSVGYDPLSLSALAHVLGKKLVESAEKRFSADPGGGGKPVITFLWDDERVNVFYSAPNGATN